MSDCYITKEGQEAFMINAILKSYYSRDEAAKLIQQFGPSHVHSLTSRASGARTFTIPGHDPDVISNITRPVLSVITNTVIEKAKNRDRFDKAVLKKY